MEQEPIYPESLRKYTPIIAALSIVLLVAFFFLPKSAASAMGLKENKIVAVSINRSEQNGAEAELSTEEIALLIQTLQATRIKHTSDNVPTVDYVLTIVQNNQLPLTVIVSQEGYLHFSDVSYRLRGNSDLLPLLERLGE